MGIKMMHNINRGRTGGGLFNKNCNRIWVEALQNKYLTPESPSKTQCFLGLERYPKISGLAQYRPMSCDILFYKLCYLMFNRESSYLGSSLASNNTPKLKPWLRTTTLFQAKVQLLVNGNESPIRQFFKIP